jgi:hypothetical protein
MGVKAECSLVGFIIKFFCELLFRVYRCCMRAPWVAAPISHMYGGLLHTFDSTVGITAAAAAHIFQSGSSSGG